MKWILFIVMALLSNPVLAFKGMIVSENKQASKVGADILNHGGNAIDAAVAVGYALAVVNPCCGNIGGGGFMTIHLANGQTTFINFREKAPLAANAHFFQKQPVNVTVNGWKAVAVPGTVMGFNYALEKYGTLTLNKILAPAIQLANEGYTISSYEAKLFKQVANDFRRERNIAAIFLPNNKSLQPGEVLKQPTLASTLQLISEKGSAAFYKGSIQQKIIESSKTNGGLLSTKDFTNYSIQELKPISCSYRDYKIISAPLPSSGGITLCEALGILQHFTSSELKADVSGTRYIIEAMHYAFADRNQYLADSENLSSTIQFLLSPQYTQKISDKIKQQLSLPGPSLYPQHELTDTTHYSVLDNKGNAVAVTYTLNGFFGARVMARNTGFFLNNEMDDFTVHPNKPNKFDLFQSKANLIEPGKRPLSSMTPTIVMKDNHVQFILGSPGGPRIITSVLLTLINVIDRKMPLANAINSPRFHYQAQPKIVFMEQHALAKPIIKQLEKLGYKFIAQPNWGAVEAIEVLPQRIIGVNDKRRPDGGVAIAN